MILNFFYFFFFPSFHFHQFNVDRANWNWCILFVPKLNDVFGGPNRWFPTRKKRKKTNCRPWKLVEPFQRAQAHRKHRKSKQSIPRTNWPHTDMMGGPEPNWCNLINVWPVHRGRTQPPSGCLIYFINHNHNFQALANGPEEMRETELDRTIKNWWSFSPFSVYLNARDKPWAWTRIQPDKGPKFHWRQGKKSFQKEVTTKTSCQDKSECSSTVPERGKNPKIKWFNKKIHV